MTDERLAALMVKRVDGVATPAECEELMAHLVDHPELHAELEDQLTLKALTDGWLPRLEGDLASHEPALAATLGAALLLGGLALLLGFGVAEVRLDPPAPAAVKGGLTLVSAGSLLLLFHLVRARILARDPYDEVVR